MSLLGIDLGSSQLKATLIDDERNLCVSQTAAYSEDWIGEKPDHLERNVVVYWEALKEGIKRLLNQHGVQPEEILGISFSVQGETFVVLDQHFRPLRKAIQGHDVRAQEEVRIIRDEFSDELLYSVSGQPNVEANWMAVKLLWIKRNEPEIFARTRYIMLLEDYILHKLTGRFVTDRSVIGDSYLYDMRSENWFGPLLDYLDVSRAMLPEVVHPCQAIGPVSKRAAEETELSTETQVVTGAMDQMAGAVGAGNVVPGVVTETTGTALAIGATGKGDLSNYLETGLPLYYHAVRNAYFLMPWLGSGGLTLQWFRDSFGELEKASADREGREVYDLLTARAAEVPASSDGLIMLPFLVGAACPEFDSSARGVFFGITPGHTKGHFVRAILESIGYAIRANLELLQSAGLDACEIRSMGGGSKSRLWNQIKADICGVRIASMDQPETASLGAALMAGVGAGVYASTEGTRSSKWIKLREVFDPDIRNQETYAAGYGKYREIYRRLKGVFE